MDTDNIFEANGLCFTYEGKQTALEDVNMTVRRGESVVILGANGCG